MGRKIIGYIPTKPIKKKTENMNKTISFDENSSQKNKHRKRKILIQFFNLNSLSLDRHLEI